MNRRIIILAKKLLAVAMTMLLMISSVQMSAQSTSRRDGGSIEPPVRPSKRPSTRPSGSRGTSSDSQNRLRNTVISAFGSRNKIRGHEYVDLGLSVMWATCNVGATKPEGYGDYFAWGEIDGRQSFDEYSSATYKKNLSDIAGDQRYDAARAKWGGTWRLPTETEALELVNKCEFTAMTSNGVSGFKVTGPNGNSIFIPAAGCVTENGFLNKGDYCYLHTSTTKYDSSVTQIDLEISKEDAICRSIYRYKGLNIRPVSALNEASYSVSGTLDGYEWVDLGLSVNWATCNLGAITPGCSGDYYAWGEITPKSDYEEYNSVSYKKEFGDIAGLISYDAARSNMGTSWRLPTIDEVKELQEQCQWEWTTYSGHVGYKVTGPNGKWIFLPAVGARSGAELENFLGTTVYWSSDPNTESEKANGIWFSEEDYGNGWGKRSCGRPIRAVASSYTTDRGGYIGGGYSSSYTGTANGREWVDLGLSVKWATCNVGASTSSDYGDYYAWGETTTKGEYTVDNSRNTGENLMDISGLSGYDVARAKWGGSWRMPTEDELSELRQKCSWDWTTVNGNKGYKVTGPNGNSIFLPATGWFSDSRKYTDVWGDYWGSTPESDSSTRACYLYFKEEEVKQGYEQRYYGQSVRPVIE